MGMVATVIVVDFLLDIFCFDGSQSILLQHEDRLDGSS